MMVTDMVRSWMEHFSMLELHSKLWMCYKSMYLKYLRIYHTSEVHISAPNIHIFPPQNKGR
jgi:hypothetical protein